MTTEDWLIFGLLFGAVFLAVQGLYQYLGRDVARKKQINRRLSVSETTESRTKVLEQIRRERGIGGADNREFGWLKRLVIQSGLRMTTRNFFASVIAAGLVVTSGLGLLIGVNALSAGIGGVVGFVLVLGYIAYTRYRRISKFGEQLPEVLDIIVRSLRAGHPLPVSLNLVAREMTDPAGSEFGMTGDELAYGLDIKTALENMALRVGNDDLLFLITAISIQSQTGGNLAEIMSRLSKLLRDRFKLSRKVHALTSEGRYSGMFLSLLPILVFLLLNVLSPSYYGGVADDPKVPYIVGTALVLLAIGNYVMYKMVNFKY
ncbi:type II secretion system F family protein [Alsobacter sp. SYSU M60028]|uniref:Type II secretion system F family protein n=1 Tax=Alsobacter ponti TaxID=2962936 RepID=A0ABT1L8P2_9HYPH|nr:type II secretion system F family protein [Alsobacter ponti]MCP8937861.1 type II secretion system F family protein [Alsobacter ponti]